MINSGALVLEPLVYRHATRIARLLDDYAQMDFGDATLVVLSEFYPKSTLVTIDVRDFTIYRRADGEKVPILAPEG
jgi:predicted nucleic acid-binding protein